MTHSDLGPLQAGTPLRSGAPLPERRYPWRHFLDRFTRFYITVGGVGVLVAILLIFFYLLSVVLPLFEPARLLAPVSYAAPAPQAGKTLALVLDEYHEVGARITHLGQIAYFAAADGRVRGTEALALPDGATVTAHAEGAPKFGIHILGLTGGRASVFRLGFEVSYPKEGQGGRRISPRIGYPLGQAAIVLDEHGAAPRLLALAGEEGELTIAAITADGRALLTHFASHRSLLNDHAETERTVSEIPVDGNAVTFLALDPEGRKLYLVGNDGVIQHFDVTDKANPRLKDSEPPPAEIGHPTAVAFLSGGTSLLVGDDKGRIGQWFPVRDEQRRERLTLVREFAAPPGTVTALAPEHGRKGFLAVGMGGALALYHATAARKLLTAPLGTGPLVGVAVAPRGDALLALGADENLHFAGIVNKHPDVSWTYLWGKVWYEGRQQPEAIWQSSAATNDFEPKYSLAPLAYGTLKGAFYAMVLAVPVAVLGAIYTGYFMSARTRGLVKPVIEVMAALPSVILGFLAGLWLAPFVEHHLIGVFSLLLILPLSVVLASFLWHLLPWPRLRRLAEGWEAALLLPVLLGAIALAISLSHPVELAFFGGDLVAWLSRELGIGYSQRNSVVVGIAMGVAVVPIVFTISEDAVFNVPKHLTLGSLALGANYWQTLVRVVLLTASPGIFSAVMIGMGRAVGETMIVLMATGNTPIMDLSPFNGFRALSANVAVEMPEAGVDTTHYRILFLAALVLFLVTFVFNTVAELVRQNLRRKYSSL
jgi:phosphate transport system permease protein